MSASIVVPSGPGHGATAPGTVPAAAPGLSGKLAIGMAGVLLAVLVAGFNEHVTEAGLADIRGALSIGHDDGTWLTAIYEACNVSAMAFAPWFASTFSIRKVTMTMVGIFAMLGVLAPWVPGLSVLYVLRALQGLAAGALPPMLMTVALRYLPPGIKVYGLGAYALTATFGPNLGTPLAALCFEYLGWKTLFWEVVPLSLLSILCVGYGLPQDPLRLERFKQFDWPGIILGFAGISMLVIALMQGDRLDWFRSPLVCHLIVAGVSLFVAFLVNEWFQPSPFFKVQMLGIRNVAYGLAGIALILVMAAATGLVPSLYLTEIQGYRPLQIAPMSLMLALPQLGSLLLVSAICNLRWVDCRWVMAAGLVLTMAFCWAGSDVTSDWYRGNFYPLQWLLVFAQPMTVIPILMTVTLKLAPSDGPFVSGMFNMTKGLANAIAAGFVDIMMTWREHTHSNILLDHVGSQRFMAPVAPVQTQGLAGLAEAVHRQASVLALADINRAMILITLVMLLLTMVLPERVFPPASAHVPASPSRS